MKPHVIEDDRTIRLVGERMRSAAMRQFVTTNPTYSKTEAEALAVSSATIDILSDDDCVQALVFPPREAFVSVVLTIDAFEQPFKWHLSICQIFGPTTIVRVPDPIATRIVDSILAGAVEGPPEGAFKQARHFRLDYKAP